MDSSKTSHSDEEVILASSRPKKRAGRKKFKETRHPVYRGVRRRNSNRWVCEVREPAHQKRIWLGSYPTAEMAARAHDVAALALRGQAACLNFADSIWRLPVPASNDPEDIRKAVVEAVEAAEAFQPAAVGEASGEREVVNAAEDEGSRRNAVGGGGADFCMNEDYQGDGGAAAAAAGEGALMSRPRHFEGGFGWDDDVGSVAEVELWSYSL